MRTWFQGLLTGAALAFSMAISQAQFVAFNDHAPGSGTAPNTTTWNVEGQSPGGRTGAARVDQGAVDVEQDGEWVLGHV